MSLLEKLERDVEMKSAADKFHAVLSCRPHHISTMVPDAIQSCDIEKGQFGMPGSVIFWNYTLDGEAKVVKELIEEIDEVNNSITVKVIEGDLLKDYKVFKIAMKATPKEEGSVVHWTFEYEKHNPQTPHPNALLDMFSQCTKDIDANLLSQVDGN